MKKNIAMRVASLVLMCTIVTSCFVSSTFAKYTSSVSGQDSVTVAKWDININGDDIEGMTNSQEFAIFDTITNSNANGESVKENMIAPGTEGSFNFAIQNSSDVKAKYTVSFTVDQSALGGKTIPFEYSVDGGSSWENSLANVADTVIEIGATSNVTVKWRWAFDSGADANDTAIGVLAQSAKQITVTATITATQVD